MNCSRNEPKMLWADTRAGKKRRQLLNPKMKQGCTLTGFQDCDSEHCYPYHSLQRNSILKSNSCLFCVNRWQ